MELLIVAVVVVLASFAIAVAVQRRREQNPAKKNLSTAQTIGLAVSIVVAAFGLFVVGAGIFVVYALSTWADTK